MRTGELSVSEEGVPQPMLLLEEYHDIFGQEGGERGETD